jgi:ATP-dependent DNA helicase DinG
MAAQDQPLVQLETKETFVKDLVNEMSPNIEDHFPFPTIRDAQRKAMAAIVKAQAEGKKFVIIEAPTGIGKSGIAIAAASWAKTWSAPGYERGAHILTPQKILAQQYMNDFANFGLLELRGKANYHCDTFDTDCDSGALLNDCSEGGDNRQTCQGCPYKTAKKAYIANPIGAINNAYFLNETQYAGQLPKRNLLILDEGHNTESALLGFADTTITKNRMKEVGLGALPTFKPGEAGNNVKCLDWLNQVFLPACSTYMSQLENDIEDLKYQQKKEEALKVIKKLDNYDKYVCRINRFVNTNDLGNWLVYTSEPTDYEKRQGQEPELLIKPLTATLVADEILFRKAKMIVIMSATILDTVTVMRNLGIKNEDAIVLQLDSEFPIENRPIFYKPQGKMNYNDRKETMPKMLKMIEKIMDKYEGKKGIIHTHSYAFTKEIIDYLRNTKHAGRIINHTSVPGSRDAAVAEHISRPDDTVLISPSMTEGLDLKEDLARFCVIIKVPFAFLDIYTTTRMRRDNAWYNWLTSMTLVQATGRIIRSKTDKGHCFILDADFAGFLNRAKLPKWWTDAIVF